MQFRRESFYSSLVFIAVVVRSSWLVYKSGGASWLIVGFEKVGVYGLPVSGLIPGVIAVNGSFVEEVKNSHKGTTFFPP